jgi:hypothetical protein
MSLYVQRVIGFVYMGSCQLLYNLTNMHQKPSACFGLCVDMVPMVYHCVLVSGLSWLSLSSTRGGRAWSNIQCRRLLYLYVMCVLYLTGGTMQWAVRHLDLLGLPVDLWIVVVQPIVAKNDALFAWGLSSCTTRSKWILSRLLV